ncbi:uncharacterized protein LTR77_005940 [Saxophila tyrrhenica]|uniref:Zn(2)-C6 fungal-type domain-containing protein n=1 Tax=Saxophila tyrrhenica TaxID=1690608 RepID=A0AAV9P6I4_9PEZI|nr:hypothetical protein LTR77_005940 [Saxophila tyrrhenica]
MDSRRTPYAAPPPPHQHNYPPHTPVDHRPPPPPAFAQPHSTNGAPPTHQSYQYGPPPQQYPPPPQHQQPPGPSGPPGPNLPPIDPRPQHTNHNLPPLPPPRAPQHDTREGAEYHAYNNHNRSGHATPAPVNRSYSHDSAHQQRTPTTPAHPGQGPYPPSSGPDPAQQGPPPPSQPMEHGGHHGYGQPNGVPHGLPPPPAHPHGPPQHHQPPPSSHYGPPPMMENHHSYPPGPPPQDVYFPQSYGPTSSNFNTQKKKQMRATQACEQCRQRKQKCDEGNPCSFCKEGNMECQYRDTPPAKTDKNMEKLLEHMRDQTAALTRLSSNVEDLKHRLRGVEQTTMQVTNGPMQMPNETEVVERKHMVQAERNVEPAPAIAEQPLPKQMPTLEDHRTAPHKLILLWPSIKPLLKDANVPVSDSYVMEAEDRGVMRIWTRGEGIDEYDGTQPGGPASPALSDDSGDGQHSTPSPPHNIWGTGFQNTPSSEISRSEPQGWGGLKPDGTLDLDVNTINTLYDSYMKNIHVMHPMLDKQKVRKIFDNFIKRYSTGQPTLRSKFAVGNNSDSERPLKRQRSNGSTATGTMQSEHNIWRREPTERSPTNGIVWLILALGKICLHKEPLEGLAKDKAGEANVVVLHSLTGNSGLSSSSPMSVTIKPNEMSPNNTPLAQATPPGTDGFTRMDMHSRRPSMEGVHSARRNLDQVPGLAYYAKAVEVLGDQGDGNDLIHAQMFLLAGLYKGQLARVKESMSWFLMAGRAIRMLLDRYKLYNDHYWDPTGDLLKVHERGQKRIKDKRSNLIVLASWTCLQLESDILAEMHLPSSGIGDLESKLLNPHQMPDTDTESYDGLRLQGDQPHGSDGNILIYYVSQMFLRKRLNLIHKEMYGDQCLNQSLRQVKSMLEGHEEILNAWRTTLTPELQWDDDDPPPTEILPARLRAKYYGARYVINRPYLDYALHIMPHVTDGKGILENARDCNGNPRDPAEIHLFTAIGSMGDEVVWAASKRCIDAAMKSTVAFDGIPDRLIVTNIHGTAHAQFGNMLVLSAAYYNKWLSNFVDRGEFCRLLERTIAFLRKLANISPTCGIDCMILENIHRMIFGHEKHLYHNEREPPSASTSFGHST